MLGLLRHPQVYQAIQRAGGFFGARRRAIESYLDLKPGDRVIDIGCGPGFLIDHLPRGVEYLGFDTDRRYIEFARGCFRGAFFDQPFDAECAKRFGPADVVMMNGLLHHLDDSEAAAVMRNARTALRPRGVLLTLDGCFRPGQGRLVRWLLEHDRGKFVRDEEGYQRVLGAAFGDVRTFVREDLSWVPYTFVIGVARRVL